MIFRSVRNIKNRAVSISINDDQGNWYYLTTAADGGTEGAMTIGWKKLSGHWYYFNGSAVMQTDWVTIGENRYFFCLLNPEHLLHQAVICTMECEW